MYVGTNPENKVLFVNKSSVPEGYGGAAAVHEVAPDDVPENPTAHTFDGSAWEPVPQFHADLQRVQTVIDEQANQALGVLERGYTEREVKTWAQQQAEAAAWSGDNAAPVPLLAELSSRRGVPLSDVVARVQAKVLSAANLTGIVLGDAQAAGDRLAALAEQAATDNLPPDWPAQLADIEQNWRNNWPPILTS